MAFVTEVVLFRARPGIAVETVVGAAEGSRAALAGLDGYIDRSFGIGADGLFGDIVRWRDLASAEAAATAAPALPGFDRFMQAIDGPSVRLYHFRSRSL
ncbi:hypothetical protein [Inquilinus sp. Marseille-Q2685]|uniref:hypothetical protein n=1 Tax=Inquilinus sp. Marseille-Q2685 TaxID=2866581 RepID=UPI001CE3BECF|nr:hypothetical protein [Inquilinus sp. Marseille-Q2685]